MGLNRTAVKCAAFTIFTELRTCFRGWFLHELRVRFGGLANCRPIRGQNLGHGRAFFRVVRWRTPVAKKRSARSKFIFFVLISEISCKQFGECMLFLLNNSELKRRLKAEQKAKEKEAKESQKVLYVFEITLHARTWFNVCFILLNGRIQFFRCRALQLPRTKRRMN